jgi:cell division protein FtsN
MMGIASDNVRRRAETRPQPDGHGGRVARTHRDFAGGAVRCGPCRRTRCRLQNVDRHQSTVVVLLVSLLLIAFVAMPVAFGLTSARQAASGATDRPGVAAENDKDRKTCARKPAKEATKEQRAELKAERKACREQRKAERKAERQGRDGRDGVGPGRGWRIELPPRWQRQGGVPRGWAHRAEAWSRMAPELARLIERCSGQPRPRQCLRDALAQQGIGQEPVPSPVVPSPTPSPAPS